ncbi:MAG TPA: hypothetical protein ENJ95_06925 [Bacteroidetes bacterium]|nr:hypothetical protein [Bacteroidota bacterium]
MSKHLSHCQNTFKGSKLARLLGNLSGEEMDSFHKFLSSPWFNGSAKVRSIFQKVKGHHPTFHSPRLTHRSIFKKAFPGEAFNRHKLDKYLSDLCKLLQRFMAQQEFEKDENLRQGMVTRFLGQHGQYGLLEKHHREAVQKLERQPIKGAAVYGQQLQLLQELYFNPDCKKLPGAGAVLPKMMNALDREYALRKLFLACEAINVAQVAGEQLNISLPDEMQLWLSTFADDSHPVFRVFVNLNRLLQGEGDEGIFTETMQLALEHFDEMEYMERTAAISLLINHAARKYHQTGRRCFLNYVHQLQLFGLQKNMFLYNGKMNESTFFNISNTAVLLGKIEYANDFIEKNKKYLNEKEREEVVALAKAFLSLHDNKAETALEQVSRVKFISLRYKLIARPLKSQCLFEIQKTKPGYRRVLHSELNAFKKFINKNNKIQKARKTRYLDFIYILKKINNYSGKHEELESLKNKFKTGRPIVARKWLLDKINGISKKGEPSPEASPVDKSINLLTG